MKALILIGGEGTRLRPLTLNTLKCMVPIVNRHFFEYQFSLLKDNGINEVVLSICHMPEKIKKLLGTGKKWGMKVHYAVEKSPLGTGGAIKNAERYLDEHTVIMNGDILTDINIKKMAKEHMASRAAVSIALHYVEDPSAYGLVETDKSGRVLKFLEKPKLDEISTNYINAGIYIFHKSVLRTIPENTNYSVERQVYPNLLKIGEKIQSYKQDFYWLDIGKLDKYMQANFDILEGRFKGARLPEEKIKLVKGAFFNKPAVIGKGCKIGRAAINPLTIIANRVKVGDGASIVRSIIWEDAVIGENVQLEGCIVGRNAVIGDNCVLKHSVIGDHAHVTPHSRLGGL